MLCVTCLALLITLCRQSPVKVIFAPSGLARFVERMRKIRKHLVYDVLHKSVVTGLIGLTAIGCGLLTWRGYRYLTYVRPLQLERKRMLAEEQMRMEQNEKEAELQRRQKEAEAL